MKTIALLIATVATVAFTGAASAAAPQGHMTGGAGVFLAGTELSDIIAITVNSGLSDGEQVNVAKNNDKSNDCDGDAGSVDVNYNGGGAATDNVICVHFSGNKRLAFDYHDDVLDVYVVVFVVDRTSAELVDKVYIGSTTDVTRALQWVNRGWEGSGSKKAGFTFPLVNMEGDFTVTA